MQCFRLVCTRVGLSPVRRAGLPKVRKVSTNTSAPHAGHVRVCHSRIVSPLMSARVSFALPNPAAAAALQARQQGLVNVGDQVVVNQCPQVRLRFDIVYFLLREAF